MCPRKHRTFPAFFIFLLVLTGCQSGATTQFLVPAENRSRLVGAIEEVANVFRMETARSETEILGEFVNFQLGELGSYFRIGARNYLESFVVEVTAYEAGLYDKRTFQAIEAALERRLEELYGKSLKVYRDHKDQIPIERKDT